MIHLKSFLLGMFFILLCFPVNLHSQRITDNDPPREKRVVQHKSKEDSTERPNVLLIMVDDVGFCDLSTYGNDLVRTPTLEWLYKTSIRLNNYHSSTLSSPTRAAVMTGRYPERLGVWRDAGGRSLLPSGVPTLPELLRDTGYRTAIFGKWHLGDNWEFRPENRGFQETFICGGSGLGSTGDYWGNSYNSPVLYYNGRPVKTRGSITETLFRSAINYISRTSEKPFFVYLAPTICALPYSPCEPYYQQFIKLGMKPLNAAFYSQVCDLDVQLGLMMKALREKGLERNTILIFTSDNGSIYGAYNLVYSGSKGSLKEGGHRVPFFIRWPRELLTKKGTHGIQDINRICMHVDVAPTILEMCSAVVPREIAVRFDGMSLRPMLLSGGESWHKRYMYMHHQESDRLEGLIGSVVLSDQYRLLNGKDFYDVIQDPLQQKECALERKAEVLKLKKMHMLWLEEMLEEGARVVRIRVNDSLDPKQSTHLSCHDWHIKKPFMMQTQLVSLPPEVGKWMVTFPKTGIYEFRLRLTPEPIRRIITADKAHMNITLERASSSGISSPKMVKETVSVPINAVEVPVRIKIPAGDATLQAYFSHSDKKIYGAYYLIIKRIE